MSSFLWMSQRLTKNHAFLTVRQPFEKRINDFVLRELLGIQTLHTLFVVQKIQEKRIQGTMTDHKYH